MSREDNPFLNGSYRETDLEQHDLYFTMPPFPFMAGGDPATLHTAKKVSGWLKELAEVGDEEGQSEVVGYYRMSTFPHLMEDLSQVADRHLKLPTYPEAEDAENGYSNREILLGAAAIYAWEEPKS